jgi:hypothetical protein
MSVRTTVNLSRDEAIYRIAQNLPSATNEQLARMLEPFDDFENYIVLGNQGEDDDA